MRISWICQWTWSRTLRSHTVSGLKAHWHLNPMQTWICVHFNKLFFFLTGPIYRGFSNTETLCSEYKYYCEECRSKQEAHKRWACIHFCQLLPDFFFCFFLTAYIYTETTWYMNMSVFDSRMRVKKLPMILALHLKRFKYMEQLQRYTKLSYRVVFPLELRLFNTSGDATNPERLYDLVAVVVHCGRWVGTDFHGNQEARMDFQTFINALFFLLCWTISQHLLVWTESLHVSFLKFVLAKKEKCVDLLPWVAYLYVCVLLQRSKPRTLHRNCKESWFLATVWWRHRRGKLPSVMYNSISHSLRFRVPTVMKKPVNIREF